MNRGERKFCEWKHNKSDSFYNALFETIFKADSININRLAEGFPEEVWAVKKYKAEPGYWSKLKKEWEAKL